MSPRPIKQAVIVAQVQAVGIIESTYKITLSPVALARLDEVKTLAEYMDSEATLAAGITIKSEATDSAGKDALVNLRKARKASEELADSYKSPLFAAQKRIIAAFKEMGAEADAQEKRLAKEAGEYYMVKVVEARLADTRAQKVRQDAADKARRLGQSVKPVFVAPVAAVERTTEAENGSATMGVEWRAFFEEGVQLHLVPDQYKKLDESRVRAAVESGTHEIPGIVIRETAKMQVR